MNHVYIFSENNKANTYGIGRYVEQLVCCLSNLSDIKISVICLYAECSEFYREIKSNICFYFVPKIEVINNNYTYYRDVFFLIYPFINKLEYNIFHFNYIRQIEILQFANKYLDGVKSCITIHYFNWDIILSDKISDLDKVSIEDYSDFEQDSILALKNDILELNKVDRIICLSEHAFNVLGKICKLNLSKLIVINNGLERPHYCVEKKEIKRRMLLKQSDVILLYVGRLNNMKGINVLLDSFKAIVQKKHNVKLFIAGDGDIASRLNICLKYPVNIIFTGYLNPKELEILYAIADIGIMPSFYEQCSYVAIEMMAHKIPVVYANSPGLDEMFDHNFSVMINKKDDGELYIDTKSLTNIIYALCESSSSRRKIANQQYELYLRKYSIDRMKEQYINLYSNI